MNCHYLRKNMISIKINLIIIVRQKIIIILVSMIHKVISNIVVLKIIIIQNFNLKLY